MGTCGLRSWRHQPGNFGSRRPVDVPVDRVRGRAGGSRSRRPGHTGALRSALRRRVRGHADARPRGPLPGDGGRCDVDRGADRRHRRGYPGGGRTRGRRRSQRPAGRRTGRGDRWSRPLLARPGVAHERTHQARRGRRTCPGRRARWWPDHDGTRRRIARLACCGCCCSSEAWSARSRCRSWWQVAHRRGPGARCCRRSR